MQRVRGAFSPSTGATIDSRSGILPQSRFQGDTTCFALALFLHDPIRGNGGLYLDAAWTFDHGVPLPLRFGDVIATVLKRILPPGCRTYGGDPLDLADLSYRSEVWKTSDSMTSPTCGYVAMRLGIKNYRLVVISKHYTAPSGTQGAR